MNHQPNRLDYLYRQYINKSCSLEEMQELFEYVSDPEMKDRLDAIADEHLETLQSPERLPAIDWEFMYNKIIPAGRGTVVEMNEEPKRGMIRYLNFKRMAAAAVILMLLAAGGYWWLGRSPKTEIVTTTTKPAATNEITPGGNKAVLTLADNATIILDNAANGKLAQQGNSVVTKTKDGEVKYEASIVNRQSAIVAYNILSTPRGGQYQLVLPDGSKVWLNSASSIRYPTAFTGNERIVEITGEAYFEVAKASDESGHKKTFAVDILPSTAGVGGGRRGRVEVLGTHFNINAYNDESAIKTTLLEGSVKVSKDAASAIIKPGQQASLSQSSQKSHIIPVQTVDADQVIAWKNGIFNFEKYDIQVVMRQIARWYDIEIVYEDIPKGTYSGQVSRNTNITNVLKILEVMGGVHFKIQGRKVIVSK